MLSTQIRSIFDIYIDPSNLFNSDGVLKPSGLTAFIAIFGFTFLSYILFFNNMSPDWIIQQQITYMGDISDNEKTQMAKYMQGSVAYSGVIGATIAGVISLAMITVFAGYFYIIGNRGGSRRFSESFSFSLWLQMPQVISLIGFMIIFTTSANADQPINLMNYGSINQIFLNLSPQNKYFNLLDTINIFHIWTLLITIIGLNKWASIPLVKSSFFAFIPYLTLFGCWALMI